MSDMAVLSQRLETLHEDVGEVKSALRSLSEAITKLALVEERQSQAAAALERAFGAIEKLDAKLTAELQAIDERVKALEVAARTNQRTTDWVDRGVWALSAASLMYGAKQAGLL